VTDIFQEVEEEVRRERFEKLWKKYGNYIIAVAALVVIGVAGYQLWIIWDRTQREDASEKFHAAEQLAQADRVADAEAAFAKLATNAPSGYATLAKFAQASSMLAEGKNEQAMAIYNTLAKLPDPELSGAAKLRIAWALAEDAPPDQIEKVLGPLTGANNPWRFAALEVLAYVDLRTGLRVTAMKAYAKLAADKNAPPGIRQRATAISEYLTANPEATSAPIVPMAPATQVAPAPQGAKPK
jgi:hypothetical protein